MPNASPLYDPAQAFTGRATGAAVTGARLLKVAAAKEDGGPVPVAHCGAGDAPIGVSGSDAAQDGVTQVYPPGMVLRGTSAAAFAFGVALEVTAAGKLQALAAGKKVAVSLEAATAADQFPLVQLQF